MSIWIRFVPPFLPFLSLTYRTDVHALPRSHPRPLATDRRQITKTTQTLAQISTLQSLLSQSLLQQSETSSRLLLEAGQGVADVRAGNKQLEKARERGGSGRVMVLTFLIGAALALLFLDYMS